MLDAISLSMLCIFLPAFAHDNRTSQTAVFYGNDSLHSLDEIQRFADIRDHRDRPVIVAGDAIASFPRNVTLIWFGDLSHEPFETAGAPEALRAVADHLGRDVRDGSAGLAKGEVRLSANCYTQSIDRADGLPT